MVGVLLFMLLLMVGVVVCILTWRRFTDKGKPEVVSERQVVEDSQRGGISSGIHNAETGECVCLHKITILWLEVPHFTLTRSLVETVTYDCM